MDPQQQFTWRPTRTQLLWGGGIAAVAFLGIVICGYLYGWKWTGLPKRTLWDWLQLLIIPAVLAGGGLWFNRQQREQELQSADSLAQDEALQTYLNQMADMLIPSSKDLPSLYRAQPGDRLSSVARARTLTVLPRLAGHRKARVIQFLYESGLIHRDRAVLNLSGADLSECRLPVADLGGADLSETDMGRANLRMADLRGANLSRTFLGGGILSGARLIGADLSMAYLRGALLNGTDLRGADLRGAYLRETLLNGADLSGATLRGTDLEGADLSKAVLEGADLRNARDWTEGQLSSTLSLKGATMPNGQKYEDWLKDRAGNQDDGKNGGAS